MRGRRILKAWAAGAVVAALACAAAACSRPHAPERKVVTVVRPAGDWQGTGTRSLGDINSSSGRFRITWKADHEDPRGHGTFRLTVRSAVSGRPLETVVDHRGEGGGVVSFQDLPRVYEFLVESENLQWSFSVDEIYEAYAADSATAAR